MVYRTKALERDAYPSAGFAWYALFCLLLVYFMYFVDRNILALLVAPVRRDLGISDTQIGILQGYSFSVFNALMVLPFGWLADRKNRRNLLMVGIAIWGASTIASGFTSNFTELVVTRMGLGIGEAALMPAAFSLISDYFPKSQRGRAVGIYGIGGFGGIGLSYLIGGAVLATFRGVDNVTLPIVGETSLWHAAFIVVGVITLLFAMLMGTVREPPRHEIQQLGELGKISFFAHLRSHWRAFWLVIGAYICQGIAIGWFVWLPTYFIREFKFTPIAAGVDVGWVTTISGVLGAVAGGYIADWMMRNNWRGGKLPSLTLMFIGWILSAFGILVSNNAAVSLACVFLFTFADGIGFMQYGNIMQEMFPAHLRARSIAAWSICNTAFSYGVGPLLFGLATDYIFTGPSGLRYAISLTSLPIMVLGLALSWWGRKPYDRARYASDPHASVDDKELGPEEAVAVLAKP
jgi:MFS family permease